MDVSIIIVNWNTRQILRDCLQSVYEQTQDIAFEVIVVDNGSSDDSTDMIRGEFPQVRLIANPDNRGFASANNQGIADATGRYILLLNSDTVVLDGAIQKTVTFADSRPDAGVFGCRVLNCDKTLQPTCFMFPSLLNMVLSSAYLYKLFPRNRFFGRERMTWWDRNDVREVEVVTGCFLMARTEVMQQVGLLDEAYFMYGEETDWCFRFKKAGWKVLFTPEPQIIHLGGQSSKLNSEKMYIQLRKSILQFMRKHRSWPVYLVACLLVVLFLALRIPWWALASLASSRDRAECRARLRTYALGIKEVFYH